MSRLANYITEKTFAIDKDVEWLYKQSGIQELFTAIKNKDIHTLSKFVKMSDKSSNGDFELYNTPSSKLTNRQSKQADKKNPVDIRIGMFKTGSYYDVSRHTIQLSFHGGAFKMLMDNKGDIDALKSIIGTQFDRFKNEFSPVAFKGTIAHELTHWIDDTLNDFHITKKVNKAKEFDDSKFIRGKFADVNHTEFEINSQVSALKQIRREMGKREFDKLDWKTFFVKKSSFTSNFKNFRSEDEYNEHMKSFVSRLHREKLLPKGMRNIPSWWNMQKIMASV